MFFVLLVCAALAAIAFAVGRWSNRPGSPVIRLSRDNQVAGNFPVPIKLFLPEGGGNRFIVGHGETGQPIVFEGPVCSHWQVAINPATKETTVGLLLEKIEIAYIATPEQEEPAEELASAS